MCSSDLQGLGQFLAIGAGCFQTGVDVAGFAFTQPGQQVRNPFSAVGELGTLGVLTDEQHHHERGFGDINAKYGQGHRCAISFRAVGRQAPPDAERRARRADLVNAGSSRTGRRMIPFGLDGAHPGSGIVIYITGSTAIGANRIHRSQLRQLVLAPSIHQNVTGGIKIPGANLVFAPTVDKQSACRTLIFGSIDKS